MWEFLVFLAILAGIIWVVINYWPIVLALIVVGVVAYFVATYEPPPNPKRDMSNVSREIETDFEEIGNDYRKRVRKILE